MKKIYLKINHFVFSWYYKRTPEFFRKWTIFKSISLLIQNYNHSITEMEGMEQVIRNASIREREMTCKISNLELRLKGITQDKIDPINNIFGTNLKGKSIEERDN